METEKEVIVHHAFSPSCLERRELCPGSFQMEKDLPSVASKEAEEGTLLHAEVERMINTFISEGKEPDVTDSLAYSAFCEFKAIYESCGVLYESNEISVFTEQRLEYKYAGITQFYGFADVVIVVPDKVIIIDWKFGFLAVESAENNYQGGGYAIAAMQKFNKKSAVVHFVNTRIKQHTFCYFEDEELNNLVVKNIMKVIAKCQEENAPLIPGEKQCKYCKASLHGTCPAIHAEAEMAITVAEKMSPVTAIANLPIEDLCKLKERCDIVAKLSSAVDERIKEICEEQGFCGEYFLKEKSGGRDCVDIDSAFERLSEFVDAGEFISACKLSISSLEKLFAQKMKAEGRCKTVSEGKFMFADVMNDLLVEKAPKKTLAKKA